MENLLELLCPSCGRNVALGRLREFEEEHGAASLGDRLCELGVVTREALDAAQGGASRRLVDVLLDRGSLRRDLRLTLDVAGEEGWHRYGAKPLKEVVLPAEVEAALERRRAQGGALTELLCELVLERMGATLRSVGEEVGLECLTHKTAIDPALRAALPTRALEIFRAVPLRREGEALVVALWNPLDFQGVRDLEALLGAPVYAVLAQSDALDVALRSLGVEVKAEAEVEEALTFGEPDDITSDPLFGILLEALEEGASEVLIEPSGGRASLRFRVRGELRDARLMPAEACVRLAEQLQGLSAVCGEHSPTSGSGISSGCVRYEVSGLPLSMDYRVVETPAGPSVALRLEEGGEGAVMGLGQLGLSLEGLATFEAILAKRKGVVVVASSRRESAYYAILQRAVRLGGVAMSLERRIGRHVPGATQLELPSTAVDLQRLLDPLPDWLGVEGSLEPDVIRLAVDVSLRGSGVVLTVPAPDAESALLRLELAGIPRRLLELYVKAVLARRVVPRVCAHCRVSRGEAGWIGLGCAACADQGTRGSIPLAELACPALGGLVIPLAGTRLLTQRAQELVQAGDVQLEAVSDLLQGGMFAGGAA